MNKQKVGRRACVLLVLILLKSQATEATQENLEDVQTINDAPSSEVKSIDINFEALAEEQTVAVDQEQTEPRLFKTDDDEPLGMDSLTIIWYLTTFTALLGFFVVMACTEKSCNRGRVAKPAETRTSPPTPCPSYKNFAPPNYLEATVMQKYQDQRVFIVPVHDNNNFFNQTVPDNDVRNNSVRIDMDKEITTR